MQQTHCHTAMCAGIGAAAGWLKLQRVNFIKLRQQKSRHTVFIMYWHVSSPPENLTTLAV